MRKSPPLAWFVLSVAAATVVSAALPVSWEASKVDALLDSSAPVLESQFRFRVSGTDPVTFTSIATSCGCVSASPSRKSYQPGDTGVVFVVFNSDQHEGRHTIFITLGTATASQEISTTLCLDVTVFRIGGVAPRLLEWPVGGDLTEKHTTVAVADGGDMSVTLLPYDETAVRAALHPTEQPGRYILSVTPRTTDRPGNARIRLQCARASQPLETLIVYSRVR